MNDTIFVHNVSKTFAGGRVAVKNISFEVKKGEMVALIGPSGSGKSTLLSLLAGLLPADRTSGEIIVFGDRIQNNGKVSLHIRKYRRKIGFVFQQFNLVPRLPLMINVLTGALSRTPFYRHVFGMFSKQDKEKAVDALNRMGLADFIWQRADKLSGGQQQRGAIARALVQEASLIIADEPVASLDPDTSLQILDILSTLNRQEGITIIASLHQMDHVQNFFNRVIAMDNSSIVFDGSVTDYFQQTYRKKA